MTKKIKIEGSIWAAKFEFSDDFYFTFCKDVSIDNDHFSSHGYIPIAPYTIEIEMPEGLDMHKAQLTALQDKRKLILADNEKRLNAIDNEISNLPAIEDKS